MKKKRYSIVDMVVLGIIQKEPMNPYRLTQFVEQHGVTRLVKLSTPAIYKSCKRLYEKEYLSGKLVRDGEAPEKMMYSISAEGSVYFQEMMTHFSGIITPFYFDFNSVLFSLEQLSYEEGLTLINTYSETLASIQEWLIPHADDSQKKVSFGNRMIVKQYVMVIEVLVLWVEDLRIEYIKEYS